MTKIIDRVNPNSRIALKDITFINMLCNTVKGLEFMSKPFNSSAGDIDILTYDYINDGSNPIALILEHSLFDSKEVFLYTATINWDTVNKSKVIAPFRMPVTTNEQRQKIQEIVFANGDKWCDGDLNVTIDSSDNYFIYDKALCTCTTEHTYNKFNYIPEVTYEEFIKMYE